MTTEKSDIDLKITNTDRRCPIGETVGKRGIEQSRIPVLSCEGACIRGEIARQAANMVARQAPYSRGCHGELLTVPDSSIAQWFTTASKVVLIDGCFLRCHGRILERLLDRNRLIQFDALAVYRKYTGIFDVDDVPEEERLASARKVADHVLASLARAQEMDGVASNRQEQRTNARMVARKPAAGSKTLEPALGPESGASALCRTESRNLGSASFGTLIRP